MTDQCDLYRSLYLSGFRLTFGYCEVFKTFSTTIITKIPNYSNSGLQVLGLDNVLIFSNTTSRTTASFELNHIYKMSQSEDNGSKFGTISYIMYLFHSFSSNKSFTKMYSYLLVEMTHVNPNVSTCLSIHVYYRTYMNFELD